MPTTGQFIRSKLVEAADKGVVIADLHRERKANWRELGVIYRGGTYSSFVRLFRWLIDLKWVEQTGEREAAFAKGDAYELKSNRIYYRLTAEGLAHPEADWYDPIAAALPEWAGSARRVKYVLPSGEPRGRPRVGPPVIKKPPKPPKVRKPKVVMPEIMLTEDEKGKVLREAEEIREEAIRKGYKAPRLTKTEIYDLYKEELLLKRRIIKEFYSEHGREPTEDEYRELREGA